MKDTQINEVNVNNLALVFDFFTKIQAGLLTDGKAYLDYMAENNINFLNNVTSSDFRFFANLLNSLANEIDIQTKAS